MLAREEVILPILALAYLLFGLSVVLVGRAVARRLRSEQLGIWKDIGAPEVTLRNGLRSMRLHRTLFFLDLRPEHISHELRNLRFLGRALTVLFYLVGLLIAGYSVVLFVASLNSY